MNKNINKILSSFPKHRFKLPIEYDKIYRSIYLDNRDGVGIGNKISQFFERWAHKIVESKGLAFNSQICLEIGAGNLNHYKYLINKNEKYYAIEPEKWFYENTSLYKDNKINIYNNFNELADDMKFDRIFSIMVLEHVLDLPEFIKKSKDLLKKNGIFQAVVPCEGELAWYLGWRFGTGIPFYMKHKKDWGKIIKYEHVNNLKEITAIVKYYFGNIEIIRSPFPFLLKTKHCSFHAYIKSVKQF